MLSNHTIIHLTHKQQPVVVLHDRQFQLCPVSLIAINFVSHTMCIDSYVLLELAVLTVTHPAIYALYLDSDVDSISKGRYYA